MASEFAPTKQMAFHFTASNCIGCHSCEAACSEKNGLPSHVSWRKVGYVETGTFPNYQRMNVSMACNHCEDPVCLKGCPTRAYVKYADTGAVIQDPEVCFGCQYCTWVCPYGAPAYNPETGTVSKCNFCVDRQEVGLKPACVDACLGHALDFGAKDELADTFGQAETALPGFPTPEITRPNVRFAFDGEKADCYTRADDMGLVYKAQDDNPHQPVALGTEKTPQFSWAGLQSSESPLAAFTLIAQGVVGAFATVVAVSASGLAPAVSGIGNGLLAVLALALGYGLFTSTMHLGRPRYFYRAMNNLRYSWVSREILFVGGFMPLLMAYTAARWLEWLPGPLLLALGTVATLFGILGIFCMVMIYRIPARPYWYHPHTFMAFFGSVLVLGPLAVAAVTGWVGAEAAGLVRTLAAIALTATVLGRISAQKQVRDLACGPGEGAASLHLLTGTHGAAHRARNRAAYLSMGLLTLTVAVPLPAIASAALLVALAGEALERLLFYSVVIPTTMPGAFFLKNNGFEEMARDTGLAALPTTGVIADQHGHGPKAPLPDWVPVTRPQDTPLPVDTPLPPATPAQPAEAASKAT